MSEVRIELRPGHGQSVAALARALLWGRARGWLVPAFRLEALEAACLAPEHEADGPSGSTVFNGPSLAPQVFEDAERALTTVFVCALVVPVHPGPRAAYLRARTSKGELHPLCLLCLSAEGLDLFFVNQARPLFATLDPHSASASEIMRQELRDTLHELGPSGVKVILRGTASPRALDELASVVGAPNLQVVHPEAFVGHSASRAGPCHACRHANQGTFDLMQDGLLACSLAGSRAGLDTPHCDVRVGEHEPPRYAYEPFDGANCTWGGGLPLRFEA